MTFHLLSCVSNIDNYVMRNIVAVANMTDDNCRSLLSRLLEYALNVPTRDFQNKSGSVLSGSRFPSSRRNRNFIRFRSENLADVAD